MPEYKNACFILNDGFNSIQDKIKLDYFASLLTKPPIPVLYVCIEQFP